MTPPYTSMATLAGYVDLGDTFDVRDLQGGIVGRVVATCKVTATKLKR